MLEHKTICNIVFHASPPQNKIHCLSQLDIRLVLNLFHSVIVLLRGAMSLLLCPFAATHSSEAMEEFRDMDLGDSS